MAITYGDHLIDSGAHDITPEQEREIEAREECARRGLDPDDDAADGALVWMVVGQEMRYGMRASGCNHWPGQRRCAVCGMGYGPEERRT
jgi:hypothetical protein